METIDWANLSFGYIPTACNVRCTYKEGAWGKLTTTDSQTVTMHIGSSCLHYGQEGFEGLKAFRGQDGEIRIFRLEDNAARLQETCKGILMPEIPTDLFREAVLLAVKENKEYVPPYDSGASLYIRPVIFGVGAQVGVKPAQEYHFIVFVTPVGPYFREGFKPTPMVIMRQFDRAAPLGTGTFKVGGNYAASLLAGEMAHEMGYSAVLYLDAKEKKYIDECGPANFFGIRGNSYITPKSTSILPSITNKSLMTLAADMGMQVEQRQIPEEELATFEEAGACGTAAVISPIERIDDLQEKRTYTFTTNGKAGKVCTELYHRLRAIQYGDEPDTHGWVTVVE